MKAKAGGLCLLLAGCATTGGIPSPDALNTALQARFAGKPPALMLSRYGPPSEEKTVNGRRYYVWHTDRSMTWNGPEQVVTTTGTVGDSSVYPYTPPVTYRQTTRVPTRETETYYCSMAAELRGDGVFIPVAVEIVRFRGQMGACQAFMP